MFRMEYIAVQRVSESTKLGSPRLDFDPVDVRMPLPFAT
jgi:hypothetical protein